MKQKRRNKGFSLIELLLVLTIIGLLATVAVPSLLKSREAAESASAIGMLHALHIAQTGYMTHNGQYATLPELNAYAENKLGTIVGSNLVRGNYSYFLFPSSGANLSSQYLIIAVKYRDRRAVAAFLLDQSGRIETLIDGTN